MNGGLLVLIIGMVLSLGVGILISRGVTTPVKKLAEGTRRIAKGDLLYWVEVRGSDEVGELARSFNKMASSLLESRRKLHGYFYRVMQSFIRVLESRDRNMRGHSHRVAEYAKKIALEMGLNKEGPLTPEEWEIIKEHPAISEDILKPAVIDREMLTIVRSHHERYDGIGYPDKINGGSISFCAQIIAVADAYDAMTSSRSYSQAMSKEEAVAELKRTAGTQFNPRIVDAFLEII